MAKKLPLIKRLEMALISSSNEIEKESIFGLTGIYISSNKITDKGIFYGHLDHKTLDINLNKRKFSNDDIKKGKELYEILENAINLPQSSMASINIKKYKKKLREAINFEYGLIKEFLKNE